MSETVSLCMIVRDNEDTIGPCIESIKPWVDEIIVVDTGSNDCTPEIVSSLGAKVYGFPWIDDFSAARNESIEHASCDWIFWMDSDDTIPEECGRKLRSLVEAPHHETVCGYVMQVRCPAGKDVISSEFTVVDHVKMFRNQPEIRFEGRIHEQVLMPIRKIGGEVKWTDIFVEHSGARQTQQARREKTLRDLRILRLDLEERPNHPFVLFNFAMTHAETGQYEEALVWTERCLAYSDLQESHVAKAHAYKTNCLFQLGHMDEALASCQTGRDLFPQDAELMFRQGVIFHSMGRNKKAIDCYKSILDGRMQENHVFRSTDPGIEGFKCRFNLGVVYRDEGLFDLAELQWRLVLDDRPGYRSAIRALGDLLVQTERLTTAQIYADELTDCESTIVEGTIILSRVLESRGNQLAAVTVLEKCTQQFPNDEPLLEEFSRQLFEQKSWSKLETTLESLISLNPNLGNVLHNLGVVYLQLGKRDKAIDALARSLDVRPESKETHELLIAARRENHYR